MKPEDHGEIYRVAYDTAHSELADISAEFDRLLARKQQLENLVLVLQSVIPGAPVQIAAPVVEQSNESSETDTEISEETSSETQSFNADPFQRRIDHVLGIGAGIRDVRKYSRQF